MRYMSMKAALVISGSRGAIFKPVAFPNAGLH